VRALPPYAIRAEGVGPYKLGASTADLLQQLPSGPRIQQFSIPGIVHCDMLRGEDDAILIGTEPQGKSTFVAVVQSDIARTETGIQVGSSRDELAGALGPPVDDPDRAHDPRVVIPSKLDNAHIVFDDDRIAAIVLTEAVTRDAATAVEHPCVRPAATESAFGACLVNGELVRAGDGEIAVLGKDGEKVATRLSLPGLVFAAPLRNPIDGRDDLVAVTLADDGQSRTWSLVVYRLLEGKLMRVIEPSVLYQITAGGARWVGADLDSVDLVLDLTSRADAIEVGGLLTTRIDGKIRDIVVISPTMVARRRLKPPPAEPVDAGTSDASSR
jgi:hypothetical protein